MVKPSFNMRNDSNTQIIQAGVKKWYRGPQQRIHGFERIITLQINPLWLLIDFYLTMNLLDSPTMPITNKRRIERHFFTRLIQMVQQPPTPFALFFELHQPKILALFSQLDRYGTTMIAHPNFIIMLSLLTW